MCRVCGLEHGNVEEVIVLWNSSNSNCSLDFSPLRVEDPLISDYADFQYDSHTIDNTVLVITS